MPPSPTNLGAFSHQPLHDLDLTLDRSILERAAVLVVAQVDLHEPPHLEQSVHCLIYLD
jgi:hypothetical protein